MLVLALLAATPAVASTQETPDTPDAVEAEETEPAPPAEDEPEADEEDADDVDADEPAPAPPEPVEPAPEPEPEPEPEDDDFDEDDDDGWGSSPIEGLGGNDDIVFIPLDDLEEGLLEQITPVGFFPYIDVNGMFRVRTRAMVNYDLDTQGTSAILPPAGSYIPEGSPADPETNTLWSTDMRLRIEPTLHITETLRVHIEADLLRNVVLGSQPRHPILVNGLPDPDRRVNTASQFSPQNAIQINEAYGELETFFGQFRAGRMDNHWGLGMFANDGDGLDADYGDNIDRFMFTTPRIFDLYGFMSIDFPDEGLAPDAPGFVQRRPYDLGQVDDADQFTLGVKRTPMTRRDRELQAHRLLTEREPVFNGGLYFSYRTQDGQFLPTDPFSPTAPPPLIYRGLTTYTTDLWVQFLYEPSPDRSIRVELEGIAVFGSIDNTTSDEVGVVPTEDAEPQRINCFDADIREANRDACTNEPGDIAKFGLALESEFHVGAPVGFGLNAGFATGGDAPNWGYQDPAAAALEFYRFNPDYHVDLILFREVIGTVTNAYYFNPYVTAKFLETGNRHMELRVDSILSRAFNEAGTPGASPWLGLEFDASLRFITRDTFLASLDGGVLFPFAGLGAVTNRERLVTFGDLESTFITDRSPSLAWTIQGRMAWSF